MTTGIDLLLDGEGLNTNDIEIVSPLDMFIQEVTILFDTIKTEVLFNSSFGSDMWKFLHNLKVSNQKIIDEITTNIASNCYGANQFKWDISIDILHGSVNDIILVHLNIYDNETADFIKTAEFSLN